jgi:hypothetical protein
MNILGKGIEELLHIGVISQQCTGKAFVLSGYHYSLFKFRDVININRQALMIFSIFLGFKTSTSSCQYL